MLDKTIKIISIVFAVLWMLIIFTEYWRYNPNYGKAIQSFQYYDLLIILIGIGSLITWYIKKKRKKEIKFLNGLSIFGGILVLDAIAVNRFCAKAPGIDFTTNGLFTHWAHIIGVAFCIFLVYLVVRVIGALFTTILPARVSNADLPLIQVALGIMVFTFLLFFLGLIGLLNAFVIIPICFLLLLFYWRHSYHIFKNTLISSITIPKELNVLGIFSFLFLTIFLTLNFVQILRPFPIGSDSLRLYVNLPNLLAEYGGLVDGNQPYNWSLFMSTGLTVFKRIDVVLGLSFFGGLLSLFALWRLSRKWLDVNFSALVLLLFYSLPMVNFLSYMDMKIDMACMFVSLCILLLYYNWIVPNKGTHEEMKIKGPGLIKANSFLKRRVPSILKKNSLLVLIGLLSGFAFGIKLTILFFFLALLSSIWFFKGGKITFITSFFLCFACTFILRLDAQSGLRQFHDGVDVLQWILLLIGISGIGYLFVKQKKKLISLLTYSLIVGSFFVLPILPWMAKNLSEADQISITSLLNGKKASPVFKLDTPQGSANGEEIIIPGIYQLPEAPIATKSTENKRKQVQRKNKGNSAQSEDLHRFFGYEVTPAQYLSLPYDIFVKTNISTFFTDVGFVLFLLFPLLFLFSRRKNVEWKNGVANLSFMMFSSLLLLIAIPSAFLNQNNIIWPDQGLKILHANESSGLLGGFSDSININFLESYGPINEWFMSMTISGDRITYPIMLILFLSLLVMIYQRIKNHSKSTQSIIVFLTMYGFLWWLLGSGAPWYVILMFCLPLIFLLKNISPEADNENETNSRPGIPETIKKYVFLSVGLIWVLLAFVHRSSNYEPFDDQRVKNLYYPAIMEYQLGNINEKKVMNYHFPNILQTVAPINRDKKAKIYMVGSPYSYFIDKNDSRVLSDTYLDFFNRMIQSYRTKDQIIKKLKEEGFGYIIFDLNMMNNDETPEKFLTRKFVQFMNTLYGNPGVELMSTNRRIKLYDTGQEVFEVFQDKGAITTAGTFAIFKIK